MGILNLTLGTAVGTQLEFRSALKMYAKSWTQSIIFSFTYFEPIEEKKCEKFFRIVLRSCLKICCVAAGNNVHAMMVRLQLILFSKTLAHFRSKVLVDFLHYVTQINCLTGAIIARHILRRLYLNKRLYDPPQLHIFLKSKPTFYRTDKENKGACQAHSGSYKIKSDLDSS
jgi:hypothetical protein